MNASELVLNIAVNLGRIARYSSSGNLERKEQFISETSEFISGVDRAVKKPDFLETWDEFKRKFLELSGEQATSDAVIEDLYTWANILTHRAKLA